MRKAATREEAQARFWSRVDRQGENDCWPWTAGLLSTGYGCFVQSPYKTTKAHRFAWMFGNRTEMPQSKRMVCHTCDNPVCCNPSHLFLGSSKDNMKDMVQKGRHVHLKRDFCKNGHSFADAEVRSKNGFRYRHCRQCASDSNIRSRARKRAALKGVQS